MANERIKKVESLIQKEIGLMIVQKKIKDPRVSNLITVHRVYVSKDIAYAKVYVASIESREKSIQAVDALNHASGFIQRNLSKKLQTRNTPRLTFIYDDSFQEGFRINKLIEEALS